MSEQVIKEIIPFTQDEIEVEVKSILLAKGLTDILYPGSNVSQLSDVMTYLIHVLNTNTAINLQEVILPLATKRMNVLFGARQLGYEATQKISYQYSLNIGIRENLDIKDPNTPYKVVLPRYTKFTSNGNDYWYLGDSIEIGGDRLNPLTNSNRFDHSFSIIVKEGDYIQYDDNELLRFRTFNEIAPTGQVVTKQNYLIPFKDVEQDGIDMFLSYVDEYGTDIVKEYWDRADQLLIDSTFEYNQRRYIRLQNLFLQMPTVFFEIGGYGNPVRLNTLIEMNIMITKGASGVAGDEFSFDSPSLASTFSATPIDTIKYGSNAEETESIRENAPIVNNSASRAVTANDYIAISQRHPAVRYAKCWGIENEYDQSRSSAAIFLSYTPERTERVFKSTDPDNTLCYLPSLEGDASCNLENSEEFILNTRYDLQTMPRHPIIPRETDPALNRILYPQQEVSTAPKFIPRPVNYIPEPYGWSEAEEILRNKPAPRFNPGNAPAPVTQLNRNAWNTTATNVGGLNTDLNKGATDILFPQDWVEDPNINRWFIDFDDGSGFGVNTGLPKVTDFSDPDELGTPTGEPNTQPDWDGGSNQIYVHFDDEGLDLIKRDEQIEYYKFYKNKANTTWSASLELANRRWYSATNLNGGSVGGVLGGGVSTDVGVIYNNWINSPAVKDSIKWGADNYAYKIYVIELAVWENASITYATYNNYLNTPEGIEYNDYWNSLGVVEIPESTWRVSKSSRVDLGLPYDPGTDDFYGPVDIEPGDIVAYDTLLTLPSTSPIPEGQGLSATVWAESGDSTEEAEARQLVNHYFKALVKFDNQPLNDINYNDANDWEIVAENDVGFRQFQDNSYYTFEEAQIEYSKYEEKINSNKDNWYLDDKDDVYQMSNPPLPPARDTNVFTVLDTFKIMTMKLNQRQPAYMNFNFEIKILKYDISQTVASINERVFNVINSYFRDYIERFDVEYFASNTQRRIDGELGDGTGVEVNLTNDISISENMYDTSSILNFNVIKYRLAFPFENLYNESTALLDARQFLPSIDTNAFSTTDNVTDGEELVVEISAGDTVYYQTEGTGVTVDTGPGTPGDFYRSDIDRGFVDLNNTPFEYRQWVNLTSQKYNTSQGGTVSVQIDDVINDDSDIVGNGANYRYVSTIDGDIDLTDGADISSNCVNAGSISDISNTSTDFDYYMEDITFQPEPVEHERNGDGSTNPDTRFTNGDAETPQTILPGTKVYYGKPAQGPNGGGTLNTAYISMANRDGSTYPKVNLNDTDFDYVTWNNVSSSVGEDSPSKDLYCRRLAEQGNPSTPPLINGKYEFNPFDYPYDVTQKDTGGNDFWPTAQTTDIILDIYLGDINNAFEDKDNNTDPIVGRYIIRNAQHQFIDIELYFGEVSATGISSPAIDAGKTFTDYGFGYVDVHYPSNIDAGSDNIPFTGYTMPRLRQVEFLKD